MNISLESVVRMITVSGEIDLVDLYAFYSAVVAVVQVSSSYVFPDSRD